MRDTRGAQPIAKIARRLRALKLTELTRRHDPTAVRGLFALINGALSIGLLAAIAHLTGSTFIFPSLGPTAFLVFYTPRAASASPRNIVLGHLVGAAAGWLSLAVFGLLQAPPALGLTPDSGVTWARAGAAALSLGTTSGVLVWLGISHPPAGATTLIVSLGLMSHIGQMPVLMGAVLVLGAQAFIINRMAGLPYPLWAPLPVGREAERETSPGARQS